MEELKRSKYKVTLIVLLIYFPLLTAYSIWSALHDSPDDSLTNIDVISGVVTGLLAVIWTLYDAHYDGHKVSLRLQLLLFIIPILGIPVYLADTRGTEKWKSISQFCLLILASFLVAGFVAMLAESGL